MPILKPLRVLVFATAALVLSLSSPSVVVAQAKPQKPAASASPPPAAPPAVPPAPTVDASHSQQYDLRVNLKSLEEWDSTVDALTNLTYQVNNSQTSQDLGGHDLSYYWEQNVMTAPTKEKLDSLRDTAQKQSVAKDTAGLQKTLDAAATILTAERVKAFAVSVFMNAQAPVVYHQYQLGPWLARATDQDRQGVNDRVSATYTQLAKALDEVLKLHEPENPAITVQRFFKLIADPVTFFNSERERLVKAQGSLPSPVSVTPRTRGDKACPPPVSASKGHDKPSLGPDFPAADTYYPPAAKANGVEGAVTLRVSISESGCIQRAEVAGTSGVAELDDAALNLAMAGNYVPAAGAGDKGTAGTMLFRVRFQEPEVFATR
jgi:TonB family protein